MIKKILISLTTTGVVGGIGTGVYYGVNNSLKKQKENQETNLWTLTFKEGSEGEEDSAQKIYKAELEKDLSKDKRSEDSETCKLENEKNLICTFSNLNNESEAKKYLETLSSSLKVTATEEKLIDKLKKELKNQKEKLKEFFGESVYENIKKELKLAD